MSSSSTRSTFLSQVIKVAAGVWALVSWHAAVCMTTGAEWSNPGAGYHAILAWLGDTSSGAQPASAATVGAWVLMVAFPLLVVATVLVRRSTRLPDTDASLATGKSLNKAVRGTRSHRFDVTKILGHIGSVPFFLRLEDNGIVVGATRMGKTAYMVVSLILDAVGSVVVTSSKPDVLRLTAGLRRQVGRVLVFDPEGVSGWPERTWWDIVAGCDDPEVAEDRAAAMVAARPLGRGGNAEFFAEGASTVLRCLLHAAALKPGGTMRDVLGWARDFADNEPYDILRNHPRATVGYLEDLRVFCRGEARETVSSTDMSVRLVIKCFAIPSVLEAVCPGRGPGFDPTTHHLTRDTLYLLCRPGKKARSGPAICALVDALQSNARAAAGRMASGHLERPMDLVLDELANVAPIPELDSLYSDGAGRWVRVFGFVQSRVQLAIRYGREEAKTIMDNAAMFALLTGCKDVELLREISTLIGPITIERTSHTVSADRGGSTSTSQAEQPLLAPHQLRTLEMGQALVLYRQEAAALVDLIPWWKRDDANQIEESVAWVLANEGLAGGHSQDQLVAQVMESVSDDNDDDALATIDEAGRA